MTKLTQFILFFAFTINEGIDDAVRFHIANFFKLDQFNKKVFNVHIPFLARRAFVFFLIAFPMVLILPKLMDSRTIISCTIVFFSFCLMYSFLRDGVYYNARAYYDLKVKGWPISLLINQFWSLWKFQSDTSSANLDLNFTQRTIMFLIGVPLFIWNEWLGELIIKLTNYEQGI